LLRAGGAIFAIGARAGWYDAGRSMDTHAVGLGALRPGDHVCFPYEHELEKWTTLVAFVRDGLLRQERCLYVGTPADQDALLEALAAGGVQAQRELERGALVLATQGETYLRTGRLDPADMLDLIDTLIDRALADGFRGLRGTGEGSKALPDELWQPILDYEAQINERFAQRPFTALCRYRSDHVSPSRAQDLLRAHPVALVRGTVCDNPFYEHPALSIGGGDNRARLDWQMHQLRAYNRSRSRLKAWVAGDLMPLVREAVQRHAGGRAGVDGPPSVPGRWDRGTVEQLVATLLRASGGGRATISIRADGQRAWMTFTDASEAGVERGLAGARYTVELPRVTPRAD
jgi:hypothetical protein